MPTDTGSPAKALGTLSGGYELREEAEAQADFEAAVAASTVTTTTAPPTTAPPTTAAPETERSTTSAPPTTAAPTAPPTTAPPPPPPAPAPAVGPGVWDQIAACESGGNWGINTGNGYYGGLQFLQSTWLGFGGGAFAPYPHQASRAQQIVVAERVVAAAGGSYGAWGGCAAQLGLP